MAKRRRRHQYTCRCDAYHFPHRFGGGKCNGLAVVIQTLGSAHCQRCHLSNGGCEVLKGQEHPRECPAVQDFIHFHELKL